ncbi:hypothetical protein [Salinigranum salinum]|uniref:hypothetical protein n=1 Tax=Salinigranum salinum TaxID=1364937 RepID=UPI00126109F3|nr:hypothetical protein [Salinigranum salinum]
MVRRTHHCRRCDAAIDPGDVYAAVDVLDAEGRLRVLLCRSCATELRAFVDGHDTDGCENDPARHDGDDTGEHGRDSDDTGEHERDSDDTDERAGGDDVEERRDERQPNADE